MEGLYVYGAIGHPFEGLGLCTEQHAEPRKPEQLHTTVADPKAVRKRRERATVKKVILLFPSSIKVVGFNRQPAPSQTHLTPMPDNLLEKTSQRSWWLSKIPWSLPFLLSTLLPPPVIFAMGRWHGTPWITIPLDCAILSFYGDSQQKRQVEKTFVVNLRTSLRIADYLFMHSVVQHTVRPVVFFFLSLYAFPPKGAWGYEAEDRIADYLFMCNILLPQPD